MQGGVTPFNLTITLSKSNKYLQLHPQLFFFTHPPPPPHPSCDNFLFLLLIALLDVELATMPDWMNPLEMVKDAG